MAVLGFAAAKGAPGTTTLVLALATAWARYNRPPLLVEADPDGGSIAADLFGGRAPDDRGVAGLALARDPEPLYSLQAQCIDVVDADFTLLLGPGCPARARSAAAAWPVLAAALLPLRESGEVDVLVDLGRARADDAVTHFLLPVLDQLVWVTGSSLADVLATRAAVTTTTSLVPAVQVVVVGPDRPYRPTEIADAVGAPVVATLPHDRHLSANHTGRGRFSPWQRAVRALTATLTTAANDTDDRRYAPPAGVVVGDG